MGHVDEQDAGGPRSCRQVVQACETSLVNDPHTHPTFVPPWRPQIFNMTQFKKIVFVDADTLMFQNIDHLFGPEYPMFTAAQTHSCCNRNAPTMLSGGFWIVEPSLKWCGAHLHGC